MGSYNYLGFGEAGAITEDRVIKLIEEKGVGSSGLRNNFSLSEKQVELEDKMAKFMGTEAAIVFPMGFATNSLIIPCIMEDYSCLIISDTLNHSSIILGCRRSGAARKVFTHGDYDDLENTLHESIVNGQPVTGRPWSK
ncbi:MAG: Serine palmitoyltransferase 2, partial [Paramarteilia canceri]